MLRPAFAVIFSLLTVACATGSQKLAGDFGRQCPLGNTTEITVTSNVSPQAFALKTAARATLRDGYEKFRVVRGTPQGDTYVMLIRMIPVDETNLADDMIVARDILGPETPTL